MIKIFFTVLLFYCCVLNTVAQDNRFEYKDSSLLNIVEQTENETDSDTITVITKNENDILSDTTLYISKIEFINDSVAAWKKDKKFSYLKSIDSLLKNKKQEELNARRDESNDKMGSFIQKLLSSGLLQFIFWAIVIAFIGFIFYKLFISNGIFKRNTAKISVIKTQEELVTATVSDYEKLIQQSIGMADYRYAVRYLFLKTLTQLADKEYLQRSADKTNYQYVQEIDADKRNGFSSLVLNYEYVWYGNVALDKTLFTGIEKKFIAFNNKIQITG